MIAFSANHLRPLPDGRRCRAGAGGRTVPEELAPERRGSGARARACGDRSPLVDSTGLRTDDADSGARAAGKLNL